ncbi:hypothetical protein A3Q56_05870 [Intoshia linei]|uniref:Uncharacterized protein n=1 Tax=Intoshia linei TaxID=1819745 RepID=A0A177AYC4_9BILA|nr:hypothetical protein A3Q56_05870 [Intoshia linei]
MLKNLVGKAARQKLKHLVTVAQIKIEVHQKYGNGQDFISTMLSKKMGKYRSIHEKII